MKSREKRNILNSIQVIMNNAASIKITDSNEKYKLQVVIADLNRLAINIKSIATED
jgi:hypothetical protein